MPAKPFVVQVLHYGNPVATSFTQMMCALGVQLMARQHRFALVSSAAPGATWIEQVRNAGIDLYIVSDAAAAARKVRALHPDIVHCHFAGFEVATTMAMATSGARIFWQIHSSRSSQRTLKTYLKSWLKYRIVGARADLFLTVSQSLATELVQWGAPRQKLRVLYTAVDTEHFRPPTSLERSEMRRKHAIQEDEKTVLFFGRDPHIKGADFLTPALQRFPSVTVVGVGLPSKTVQTLRNACRRLITVDQTEDVRGLYWLADRLIMPSRWEGMPFTLLESLSCGLPALTSKLGCFMEVASEMPGLICVDVENSDDFAAQLSKTDQIRWPSQNSLVAARWSFEKFLDSVQALYEHSSR